MKKLAGSLVALMFAGTLAACGDGGADMDSFMKLDTEKGEAFAVGGEDCVAKAKSVREWRSKHHAEYQKARKALAEKYPKGPPDDIKKKYGEQMQKNKKAVMSAMIKCTNTPEFDAAIDETKTK